MTRHAWTAGGLAIAAAAVFILTPHRREPNAIAFDSPDQFDPWPINAATASHDRRVVLKHARVWSSADPSSVDFSRNLPDPEHAIDRDLVRCRFIPKRANGTTTKFDCALPDGEVVKVKYGVTAEIPAEIAASRLLKALGFGADRMYAVARVLCYGCPRFPFQLSWVLDRLHLREAATRQLPADRYTEFENVAIERPFEGHDIEADGQSGWAWYELENDPDNSDAERAERDALRLMAMFIAHWDNKAENQRLVCLDAIDESHPPCRHAFAFIHDLGSTFGPNKLNLDAWKRTAVWTDPLTCSISMRTFPYGGGTFEDSRISEAGRRLLSRQLSALTEPQISALFRLARFAEFDGSLEGWVAAFEDKVRQVVSAGPCEGR
jgi:hypothetical protein